MIDPIATVADVEAALARVYGDGFAPLPGVLHSASVWEGPDGPRVLRIGEHAPKSAWDHFLLQTTRARADAIVTTGRILREEPQLRYNLEGPPETRQALHHWREQVVGKTEPPRVYVLSSGRDLSLDHPTFGSWAIPTLALPENAPEKLLEQAHAMCIAVERLPSIDLRTLVEHLRTRYATVSIEAGPSSGNDLYTEPMRIDELVLGRFVGQDLDPRAAGGAFYSAAELEARFGPPLADTPIDEPSGPWRFARYRR
ncbi:MAG: hypothetical protein U0230_01555 [Polyangiales bacterium]